VQYTSHQQLDAIAIRRELARVREAAQVAAEASDRALQDVRAQADAAAQEGLALRHMLAGTLQALNDEKDRAGREVALVRDDLAAAERQAAAVQQHLAGVQSHLAMVQRHLAAVQNHLNIILNSRSWRLTRPYRRIVEIVRGWRDPSLRRAVSSDEQAVGQEILEPVVAAEIAGPMTERLVTEPVVQGGIGTQAAAPSTGPSGRTPEQLLASLTWTSRDNFLSKRFAFVMSVKRFDGLTRDGVVTLLKSRPLIEIYCKLLGELAPRRVLEVGFFQGGMPLLVADLVPPEKFVGVDRNEPTAALTAMIERAGLSQSIKLYGGISQSDPVTITQIVDAEFQGQPLDLIIDDASHEYENTKKTFEELFGYLRPGGKYVIEDWGWLHWPGEQWQTAKNPFWNQPAMTNLIFEIVMALATLSTATIAQIEVVSHACVIVTRGRALKYGARLDLEASRLACGRVFQLL
jgi:SAM-dependent methyltransferase